MSSVAYNQSNLKSSPIKVLKLLCEQHSIDWRRKGCTQREDLEKELLRPAPERVDRSVTSQARYTHLTICSPSHPARPAIPNIPPHTSCTAELRVRQRSRR
eukprot:COSAG05_NODE_622_length_8291_cov_19.484985_9_plen_101_part_00